ncbi:MAG: DNA-directed RNA polymerase subunit omega [Hormoscilla sp. GM7CHS1pb]|nr:DNA-directed RNA polymerase subunit omega [Hormoscilla sp. GM7CHS1pb]
MSKRSVVDSAELIGRGAELIGAASNRYRITVQVARRAHRRRYEDFDSLEEPKTKPVLQAIIEMSDELSEPEIIRE